MNTTDSSLNRSRRCSNSRSSMMSLTQRGASVPSAALLAQPRHRPVEVMELQAVRAGDGVVRHPFLAGPVGAGDEEAVQHRDEDGALDGELEAAVGEQRLDHRPATGLLPQPAEQQRRTNPPADHTLGGAAVDLRQKERPLGIAGDRRRQPFQPTRGQHRVLAPEVLDDPLLGPAGLADALDQVEVGVAVDRLLAHEHAAISSSSILDYQPKSAR
jgi:hypothetical protein